MSKIVIIGAGPSGMIAALNISKEHEVILLEGNDKCGKKILLTGNGKCNYWNENINISKYQTDDVNTLEKIISKQNQIDVLNYLENIGIYPRIKNGYYYPYSNQASSVREILVKELERNNIKIITNFKVENVNYSNNKFIIISKENQEFVADKVIISTGSYATPKTGSDGSGYKILGTLGHKINKVTPALTPLISNEKFLKDWSGVRCDAKVSLYIDGVKVKEDIGEIQLTNYGISGICTFNISGLASKALASSKKVNVKINFLPNLNSGFYEFFDMRNKQIPNRTIQELLESLINYKLMFVLLKVANINLNSKWDDLDESSKLRLCKAIAQFNLDICDTEDFEKCQVCTGGISLKEINPDTMESKIIPNLYLVGELLDVDGICGGFNLAFAWISGYLAGRGV